MTRKDLQEFTIIIWLVGFLICVFVPFGFDFNKGGGYIITDETEQIVKKYAVIDKQTQKNIHELRLSGVTRFTSINQMQAKFPECFSKIECKNKILELMYHKKPFNQLFSFVIEVFTPWLIVMITTFYSINTNHDHDNAMVENSRAKLSLIISTLFQLGVVLYLVNICFINTEYFLYEDVTSSAFFVVVASIVGTIVNFIFPNVGGAD
ncbi:hypothetical protein OAG1_17730 [Agarivorans sp. OAG1]|uniref:hypothetical protein n=1 Tax=Agarivorans sp. OAG1 TaxID=3082387 RepID=UPI002B2A1D2E|nr:hypothetical protein OAG1_17730 [Agarivorans sp. OAG1]